jgi:hypothetical protein
MSKVQIFKDYKEFQNREDKTINGVSQKFLDGGGTETRGSLLDQLTSKIIINDLHLIDCEGCWNCIECVECKDCIRCDYCKKCINCEYCCDCINCKECEGCYDCIECLQCKKNIGYKNTIGLNDSNKWTTLLKNSY